MLVYQRVMKMMIYRLILNVLIKRMKKRTSPIFFCATIWEWGLPTSWQGEAFQQILLATSPQPHVHQVTVLCVHLVIINQLEIGRNPWEIPIDHTYFPMEKITKALWARKALRRRPRSGGGIKPAKGAKGAVGKGMVYIYIYLTRI